MSLTNYLLYELIESMKAATNQHPSHLLNYMLSVLLVRSLEMMQALYAVKSL